MLNDAWSLLINRTPPADGNIDGIAAELVSPDYREVALPTELNALRTVWFGASPDRHMLSYRARQLLAVVETSPLRGYLTATDSRVVYRPRTSHIVLPSTFGAFPRKLANAGNQLLLYGSPSPADASGILYSRYEITTPDSGTNRVRKIIPPGLTTTQNSSTTTRCDLGDSGIRFRLDSLDEGQNWMVEVYARPQLSPIDLLRASSRLGEPVYRRIFGTRNEEPYRLFQDCWASAPDWPLRLAGLVCGLIYRTRELANA